MEGMSHGDGGDSEKRCWGDPEWGEEPCGPTGPFVEPGITEDVGGPEWREENILPGKREVGTL